MEISVSDADPACMQPTKGGEVGQLSTSAGVEFFTENTVDLGAGNAYDSTRYSTTSATKCISIVHVMHSTNPEMYDTPPSVFDRDARGGCLPQAAGHLPLRSVESPFPRRRQWQPLWVPVRTYLSRAWAGTGLTLSCPPSLRIARRRGLEVSGPRPYTVYV